MDKKRLLFLVVFILVSIGLAFLIYKVFFSRAPEEPGFVFQPGEAPAGEGQFPAAGEGADRQPTTPGDGQLPLGGRRPTAGPGGADGELPPTQQVVSDFLNSPSASAGGGVQFYNEQDGRFYRLVNGELVPLSDQVFFNVEQATWAPGTDRAVLEYPDGSNIFYDFETGQQHTLPKHWEDFSFSEGGDRIAAKNVGLSPEARWLVASDPDGTNVNLIENMGENAHRVEVDWSPNRQVVALSRTGDPMGADREQVLMVGLHGENFKGLVVEGRDFESQWSPTGEKILYSVHSARSNFVPEVWISGAQGSNIGSGRKPLSVNTWAHKCTFADERTVYCAVPQELETGIGFAPELADEIADNLYRIDVETGTRQQIPLGDGAHTINKIIVDENGDVFFTENQRQGLFAVNE